jgi:hypothetical protein
VGVVPPASKRATPGWVIPARSASWRWDQPSFPAGADGLGQLVAQPGFGWISPTSTRANQKIVDSAIEPVHKRGHPGRCRRAYLGLNVPLREPSIRLLQVTTRLRARRAKEGNMQLPTGR